MNYSREVIDDYKKFRQTGKSPLDLIFDSIENNVTVEEVINRFQALIDPNYIGLTKFEKGWASLSQFNPHEVRSSVAKYNDGGYSSFALKETSESILNTRIRVPLVASYGSNTRLFLSGEKNKNCYEIMNIFAKKFKINIEEDSYITSLYKYSRSIASTKYSYTITFNNNLKQRYETISLSDAEKMLVVMASGMYLQTKKAYNELKLESGQQEVVKHCANILTMLSFCSSLNLGKDKQLIYTGLAMQLSNSLALIGGLELKNVAKLAQYNTQMLHETFGTKPSKYYYQNATLELERIYQAEKLQAETEEKERKEKLEQEKREKEKLEQEKREQEKPQEVKPVNVVAKTAIIKSDKVVKQTSLLKMMNKIVDKALLTEIEKSNNAYDRVTVAKTKSRHYANYEYYEQMLAQFSINKESQSIRPSIYKDKDDKKLRITTNAIAIIQLRDKILEDIKLGKVDIRGIGGTLSALNKYSMETFKMPIKKYIKLEIEKQRQDILDEEAYNEKHPVFE